MSEGDLQRSPDGSVKVEESAEERHYALKFTRPLKVHADPSCV